MKKIKRLVVMLFVFLITVTTLSGCGIFNNSENFSTRSDDVEVIGDSLVYYKDTKVVYIMITLDSAINAKTASYFAPYISANGKYCRYIDGDIVEIE